MRHTAKKSLSSQATETADPTCCCQRRRMANPASRTPAHISRICSGSGVLVTLSVRFLPVESTESDQAVTLLMYVWLAPTMYRSMLPRVPEPAPSVVPESIGAPAARLVPPSWNFPDPVAANVIKTKL